MLGMPQITSHTAKPSITIQWTASTLQITA
jgi:hypothetical protein